MAENTSEESVMVAGGRLSSCSCKTMRVSETGGEEASVDTLPSRSSPPSSFSSPHSSSSPSLLSEVCEVPAFLSLLTSADIGRLATVSRCCHGALHKHPPPPPPVPLELSPPLCEESMIHPAVGEDRKAGEEQGRLKAGDSEGVPSPASSKRRHTRIERKKRISPSDRGGAGREEDADISKEEAMPGPQSHSLVIRSSWHQRSSSCSASASSRVLLCPHLRVRGRRVHQWLPSIHWGVVRSLECTKTKSRSLQETQLFLSMALRLCCTYSSRALRHVNLSMNGLNAATAPALANLMRVCPKLEELDLTYNRLGDSGAVILAEEGLPYCQRLEVLILNDNRIGNRGASALLQALRYTKKPDAWPSSPSSFSSALPSVVLNQSASSSSSSSSLPLPCSPSPLRRLYLQDNFITAPFLRETASSILASADSAASSAFCYPALKKLFLGGNQLSDLEDLRDFLKALATSGNFNLKVLVLRKNGLPSSPALEMCKSLLQQATRYGAKSLACGLMMLDLTQGCASNFTALAGGVRLAA